MSAKVYLDRVDRMRVYLTHHGLDVVIVLMALVAGISTAASEDPGRPSGLLLLLEAVVVGGVVLVLLLRHRAPFIAPATTWLFSAGLSFLDGQLIVHQASISIAGMVSAVLLGNLSDSRQSRVGLALVVSCAAVVVFNDPAHSLGELFLIPMLFAVGWLVGFALRERTQETRAAEERAAQAERDREVAARIAVAEERARIARELHDVVAHAVSVMVLQVGAVRHRMPASDSENREALGNVEQAGRAALAEMRHLLDAMRREGDEVELVPQRGLGDLDALVGEVRASGLEVQVKVLGQPAVLPSTLDLSAYRIVQEALTNTLKHARARRADVAIAYRDNELLIEVRDDGRGPAENDGLGHGLVGIAERVKIYGGDMSAGAVDDGGYLLRARLPLNGAAR